MCLAVLFIVGCGEQVSSPIQDEERPAIPESSAGIDTLFQEYDRPALQVEPLPPDEAQQWADSVLQTLSLTEKIGQLFIVEMPDPAAAGDAAMQAVKNYHVGGFLIPRLLPPEKLFAEARRLQQAASVPLFMAADYERGVGRFANNMTELPSNMGIGATRQPALAAAAGRLTALESRAVGVNLLFAPVVDVNNNPDNPMINIRSYGGRPRLVGRMAEAYVHAAESHGALTTLKHFPGHGNVDVDTHAELGVVPGTRAALDSIELRPYRMVINEDQPPAAVMSAHLWVQAFDEEPTPATFSGEILRGLLREEFGFRGLIVTDDVTMGALSNDYTLAERVTRPLQAGADLILTPGNVGQAVRAVREAIERGTLSERALDASVRRILAAKARARLFEPLDPKQEALQYLLDAPRGQEVAQVIADEAITLLKAAPVLPLREEQEVALVQLSNFKGSESIAAAMDTLRGTLQEGGYAARARFDGRPPAAQQEQLLRQTAQADVVVLALYLRLQERRGEAGLLDGQTPLVQALLEQDVPVVLVTLGNPYAVSTFPGADAHLVAYDQTIASVHAAVGVLRGTQHPRGELPITVAPYDYGAGLDGLP